MRKHREGIKAIKLKKMSKCLSIILCSISPAAHMYSLAFCLPQQTTLFVCFSVSCQTSMYLAIWLIDHWQSSMHSLLLLHLVEKASLFATWRTCKWYIQVAGSKRAIGAFSSLSFVLWLWKHHFSLLLSISQVSLSPIYTWTATTYFLSSHGWKGFFLYSGIKSEMPTLNCETR